MSAYHEDPAWIRAGECAVLRNEVSLIAATDLDTAIATARSIPIPWYTAQALSNCANTLQSNSDADPLIREAVMAGLRGHDEYVRVACCAWPLAAAARRHLTDTAMWIMDQLQPRLPSIEPVTSREAALRLLWQALVPLGREFFEPLLWRYVEVCSQLQQESHSRLKSRGRSGIATLVLQLMTFDVELAQRVLVADIDPAHAARVRARSERGERYPVFFDRDD